jgi:hypothetical protein
MRILRKTTKSLSAPASHSQICDESSGMSRTGPKS